MILSIIKIANLFVKFNGKRKIVIWSERKKHNGMFSKLIKTIRDLLEKISGKFYYKANKMIKKRKIKYIKRKKIN